MVENMEEKRRVLYKTAIADINTAILAETSILGTLKDLRSKIMYIAEADEIETLKKANVRLANL